MRTLVIALLLLLPRAARADDAERCRATASDLRRTTSGAELATVELEESAAELSVKVETLEADCAVLRHLDDLDDLAAEDARIAFEQHLADATAAADVVRRLLAAHEAPALARFCKRGNADACVSLGEHYDTGFGVARSAKRAKAYFDRGIKVLDRDCRVHDDVFACRSLADAYDEGLWGRTPSTKKRAFYQAFVERLLLDPPVQPDCD